jgi:hypothetical protein
VFELTILDTFSFKSHSVVYGKGNNAYFSGTIKNGESTLEIRPLLGNEPEKLDNLSFQVMKGDVGEFLIGKTFKEVV